MDSILCDNINNKLSPSEKAYIDNIFNNLLVELKLWYRANAINLKNIPGISNIYKYENIGDLIKSFKSIKDFNENSDVYIMLYNYAVFYINKYIFHKETPYYMSPNFINYKVEHIDFNNIIIYYNSILEKTIYKNIDNKISKIIEIIVGLIKIKLAEIKTI
jgi:hypothetical protein